MTQLFTPTRDCSAIDLVDNALGSALGVVAGLVFVRVVNLPALLRGRPAIRDRSAVALLFCWVATWLFPLFPVLSIMVLRAKVSASIHSPILNPAVILLQAGEWFTGGVLLRAAGFRPPLWWLLPALIVVPAQFGIVDHDPIPSDFIGAALGVGLFYCFDAKRLAPWAAAATLLCGVMATGLTPYRLAAYSQPFGWIPFLGFLRTDWQYGILLLLRKLFEYGGSIWLLRRAGLKLPYATCVVAALLSGIEVVQTRLPQHVPEITDPLLAALLGVFFQVFNLD